MVERMNQKFKKHEKDTGSSSVQIEALSYDINLLTGHMNTHKKDFACRRSLLQKVAKRRSLLNYLKRTDEVMYKEVTSTLGLKR
ncbi:MAG: 30S ribosomal protein S15 [Proteobacteria bacterium]|nr:30S ribosomal protein S15 [Pseudomonadota bacterium]NBP15024.1 30S ribosomal protein S15 [bacterium]